MQNPHHPTGTNPGTAPATDPAPGGESPVQEAVEQARASGKHTLADITRRLGRGENLSAEQVYIALRAQTLATWWQLVDRHIKYVGGDQGQVLEQTLGKFVSWVGSYLDDDDTTPDVALSVGVLGPEVEREFAIIHLNRAMALIRRDAARTFIAHAHKLVPACAEQIPDHLIEQETTHMANHATNHTNDINHLDASAGSPGKPAPGRNRPHVEFFQMLAWRWNVTAAKKFARGREAEGRVNPREWSGMLHLVAIDTEHAANVDMSEPLIVVTVPDSGMLIIDGWHRLYKAIDTGVLELSAVILTPEEELTCRIVGGEPGEDADEDGEDEYDDEEKGLGGS